MPVLFVVNRPSDWPNAVPGVEVVTARTYVGDPAYADLDDAVVVNLCRTDRYQGRGYYVSLIAEARDHRPVPDARTIEACDSGSAVELATTNGEGPSHWPVVCERGKRIEIDAYFGRDPDRRNDVVCQRLFARLRAPLIRARFERRGEQWELRHVRSLSGANIPAAHRPFAAEAAAEYLSPPKPRVTASAAPSIAILYDADEPDPPSNRAALERLCDAATALGMRAQIIKRGDIERLPTFDALFIRDTTNVNHYTYQFARRAVAEGLVVIDDPDSILKCNNKVFVNELLTRHRVAVPKTIIVQRDDVGGIIPALGLPCIVKQPDSSFSRGVAKIDSADALKSVLDAFFASSDLVIAQEWLPTEFDWRVGVLDRRPLFVCKYMMAPGHWQIVKRERNRKLEGPTIAMAVGEAPEVVVRTALNAANLIGDGLYGVDLKQVGDRCYVIEVNDNPNIDAGNEDRVLKEALYREVMGVFLRRIRERAPARAVTE